MATKREVKAILNSKKLTGQDAARLIMRHLWEEDHGRPGILTEAEIQQLRSNVSRLTEQDVDAYNDWMELYRLIAYTLKEAEILSLQIQVSLHKTLDILERTVLAWKLLFEQERRRPAVFTQKQFEELKARWREHQLQQLHCLGEVIFRRMCAKDDRAAGLDMPDGEWNRLWHECAEEVEELVASGQLEPVELELRADDDKANKARSTEPVPAGCEKVEWHPAYHADDVSPEEVDRLYRHYVSGEQLYQAGLSEWQKEIDGEEWDHDRVAYELDLPEAERGAGVAMLQEPVGIFGVELDEHGHYKPKSLVELSALPAIEERLERKDREGGQKWMLRQYHSNIRRQLRVFLAHQPILEALSETVGFRLDEDMEMWLRPIHRQVKYYKALLDLPHLRPLPDEERRWFAASRGRKWLERKPELPSFTIDDLKPDLERVQHLKERMSLALGEDCYQAFREWLTEMCRETDEVENRLAEELSQDEEEEA